jgi:hypothetical protein
MAQSPEVKLKKFVVIPRDAFDLLSRREATYDEAVERAESDCSETGMAHYVVELRAVAARADRPVKVRKL